MVPAIKATHMIKFDIIHAYYSDIRAEDITTPERLTRWSEPTSFIYWAPLFFMIWPAQWISSFRWLSGMWISFPPMIRDLSPLRIYIREWMSSSKRPAGYVASSMPSI